MLNRRRSYIFCGVGKSGLLADLFSASLRSAGFAAFSIDSSSFLHGDAGILKVSTDPQVIFISKSGSSYELALIASHLRKHGIGTSLWTSIKNPPLEEYVDDINYIECEFEGNSLGLPSRSLVAYAEYFYGLFNSALIDLEHEIVGFSHPHGAIGRALERLENVMHKDVENLTIDIESLSHDRLLEKMALGKLGVAFVTKYGKLFNVITDGDVRRCSHAKELLAFARIERQSQRILVTSSKEDALLLMKRHVINVVPVVKEDGHLVGYISKNDYI